MKKTSLTPMKKQTTHRFGGLLLGALGFLLFSAGPAWATTRTVKNLKDDGSADSLRELINASVAGDTINFSVSGTIRLTKELEIGRSLTIVGPAGGLTVSGDNEHRVFLIIGGASVVVSISGLTIADGASDLGGGIATDATL